MNSRVSVDAETELRRAEGGGGDVQQDDFEDPPSLTNDGQKVVLVLPSKDNLMASSSTSEDCLPIMVNGVPVYISHTSTGSPLYIRQYPPTLEEIMGRSPDDLMANFDGFSEASGQTFEGFSEASCSSVLFEGFAEDGVDVPTFSVVQNLGKIIREDLDNFTANDFDDDSDFEVSWDSQSKKKSAFRSSRKSSSCSKISKDSPGRIKRSCSSDTPSQMKRVKQEGITLPSSSSRRQSTEKQKKEPPESSVSELQGKKPRNLPSPGDPDYIGERCNDVGCTVSFLERMAIKDVKISNGIVQELADFASRIYWDKEFVVRWIQRLSGTKTDEAVDDSDLKSIQAVLKRRKALAIIHSGNQLVKSKLKSFDDTEFVLPSITKRQCKEPDDRTDFKSPGAVQGTDDEASSMSYPEYDRNNVFATCTVLHPDVNDKKKQDAMPEIKKTQVAVKQEKEEGESRRGVKRATHGKENENKRRVSTEVNTDLEKSTADKTVEQKITKAKEEEKNNKKVKETVVTTRRETERDPSSSSRRRSVITSQDEERKIFEKDQGQRTAGETDKNIKTERIIGTRRASMLLAREEKEKQAAASETQEVGENTKRDRRSSRRSSIIPKQEEEKDDNNRERSQTTDKKKKQVNDKEMKKLEGKEHDTQPIDTKEDKQLSDRRKEKKNTHEGKEFHTIEEEEVKKEEPANKTEIDTPAGRRIGTRRASLLLAKQEKEKVAGEKEDPKQTAGRNKIDTSDDRSSRRTSAWMKSEDDNQVTDHKAEQQTAERVGEVPVDQKHEKQAKDNKKQMVNKEVKASEKEAQVVSEIKMENKIGTRRVCQLARQEKEKQSNETEVTKQADEKTEEKVKKSERIRSRRDKEDSGKQDREGEKEKESIGKEGRGQTAVENEKETARDKRPARRESILLTKLEGGEQVKDKEKEKHTHQEVESKTTDRQEKQVAVKTEKGTKRERTSRRRESLMMTKQEGDVMVKEAGRDKGSRRMRVMAKTKQEEEKQTCEDDEEKDQATYKEREYDGSGTEKELQMTDKTEKAIDEEPKQAMEKVENNTKRNRRSSSRRQSMITNEEREKGNIDRDDNTKEKVEKGAKSVETSKQKGKPEEREMSDQKLHVHTDDKESHIGTSEIVTATDKDENKMVSEETQLNEESRSVQEKDTSAYDEQNAKVKETKSLGKDKECNKEEARVEEEINTSVEEEKIETHRRQEINVNDNQDGSNEENQILLKRNKVINKDKRISRWQNRKMGIHEEKESSKKEDINLSVKDSPERSEPKELVKPEQISTEDFLSDESDAGSLVIDEGDGSMQSDLDEDDLQETEKDNSNKQSDPSYSTPKRRRINMSDDEVDVNDEQQREKIRQILKATAEDSLLEEVTNSPGNQTKKPKREESGKETSSEEDTAHNVIIKGEDDSRTKEMSPQGATTPGNTDASVKPQGTESSYDGTLGVSKSGRLRKASAKGIQSIEIKCLFMQRNGESSRPPPPLPALENEQNDEDWTEEKRSPMKQERKDRDLLQEKRSPAKHEHRVGELMSEKKSPLGSKLKKSNIKYKKTESEYTSYSYIDGHLVPRFKETDYYLGDYCAKAGITVHDLNSDKMKKVRMTFGMIKELHDFYITRRATKTSLAIRLFKMTGKKILDNTHLLSTVIRLTNVGAIKSKDKERLSREFLMPNRVTYRGPPAGEEMKKIQVKRKREPLQTSPEVGVTSPSRVRRSPKKRGFKPEDSGDEECYDYGDMDEDEDLNSEIHLTRGEDGSITRGDIVHLYTKWLSNKMSLSSNTFVTDLLRAVEQLMAERHIARIRIPAGTLMSSSVRLHDEYKQILRISKEDAIMYLQEDWLEDIKYLLSISGPSRRSTTEGEATLADTGERDSSPTSEKHVKSKTPRRRSGGSKEEEISDFKGEPLSNTLPFNFKSAAKQEASRSHQMESVGKRLGKRRSIRKSLQDYERDILLELEKEGMLEEEEEDVLSQLDREEMVSESEEEKEKEKKKERQRKNQKEEKKVENEDKNKQKKSTPVKKNEKSIDDSDFEVEKIVDYQEVHDGTGKHVRYLVRWIGFGPEDDSWVDERNLQCPSILEAFWKRKKKTTTPDKPQPAVEQDPESPKEIEHSIPRSPVKDPKESEENIIQVMVKHGSAQHAISANKESAIVTKRELLSLYDSWRQENQDDLIAGGSNTVNVDVLKGRVRNLMASRNVEFYPESLLNACFMMTLMKTRLQSKIAIDRFLDTSCLEVLESSHRQYLKRKYSQIEEVPTHKQFKDQKPTVLSLQNELHSLKLDLTTAQKWRAVKNSQLGAVEEEVNYLETAVGIPNINKKTMKIRYFRQELQKLKNDIRILEKHEKQNSNTRDAPLFGSFGSDPENYKMSTKIVRNKLTNMKISKSTVDTIMDVVTRKVSSQRV